MSGRVDDVWLQTESGGSVFREAHLLRRRDGKRKWLAPLGQKDWHYVAPEAFLGGAVGFALPTEYSDASPVLLGFDLPKPLPAQNTFAKGAQYPEMVALDDGTILALGYGSGAYL